MNGYDTEQNLTANTNVGYKTQYSDSIAMIFGGWSSKMYLYAIKDIKAGEELSRHY